MGRRALLLNFAFWTFVGVFVASSWVLSPIGEQYPYPGRLLASALFNVYLWAALTPAIFRLGARTNAGDGVPLRRLLWIVGIGLGVSAGVATGGSRCRFVARRR